MRSTTYPLSSQRKRGPMRRVLAMWHGKRDFERSVVMGPRLRGDDTESVTAFMPGWFDTIAFMRANKAETVKIAKDVMQTDDATTAAIYDELMPMFSDDGRFEPKALAVLGRSFVEMKTLPTEPDMSKLYTNVFLPKK